MFESTASSRLSALMIASAIILSACWNTADEVNGHRSVIQVEPIAADTAHTAACIRAALLGVVSEPDQSMAALAQCWEAATPGTKTLLWHRYHEAMARAAYKESDMLTAMLHCDSALNHGSIRTEGVHEASIAVLQSRIFAWTGDFDAASTVLNRALDLYSIAQDTAGMADCLEQLGWAQYRQDHYNIAKDQWSKALELRRSIKDSSGIANNLRWVGIALIDSKDGVHGALYYDSSLYMARVLKDPYLLSCAHDDIGAYMDSALYFARIYGDKAHLYRIMYTAGQVLIRHGKVEEGLAYCDTVLAFAQRTGNAVLERDALLDLGNGYRAKGMWKQALMLNEKAREIDIRVIQPPATKAILAKQSILNEYRRRQIGDSIRYVRELEQLEGERNLATLRAERNSILAWAVGLATLAMALGVMGYHQNKLRRQKLRHERDKARSELRALRAQMNPHFIFNALASINDYVADNERDLASSYLTKFAMLMRLVLENSRETEVTLAKDLKALELYMELEQLRMNGKFQFLIELAPALDPEQVMVPPLALQPFVENAIWHGIAHKEGSGRVDISIKQQAGRLVVTIVDNGVGIATKTDPADAKDKHSLGTEITRERLALIGEQHGVQAGFRYVKVVAGTWVEVVLPLIAVG